MQAAGLEPKTREALLKTPWLDEFLLLQQNGLLTPASVLAALADSCEKPKNKTKKKRKTKKEIPTTVNGPIKTSSVADNDYQDARIFLGNEDQSPPIFLGKITQARTPALAMHRIPLAAPTDDSSSSSLSSSPPVRPISPDLLVTTSLQSTENGEAGKECKSEAKESSKGQVDVATTLKSAIVRDAEKRVGVATEELAMAVTKATSIKSALEKAHAETKGMARPLASYVSAPSMLPEERKEVHDQIRDWMTKEGFQRSIKDLVQTTAEKQLQETYNVTNDANGAFTVGCFYMNGHGVTQNTGKALTYFMGGVEKGHTGSEAAAGYLMSMMCYHRRPESQPWWFSNDDDFQFLPFVSLLKLASDAGDVSSQFFLGRWYPSFLRAQSQIHNNESLLLCV